MYSLTSFEEFRLSCMMKHLFEISRGSRDFSASHLKDLLHILLIIACFVTKKHNERKSRFGELPLNLFFKEIAYVRFEG